MKHAFLALVLLAPLASAEPPRYRLVPLPHAGQNPSLQGGYVEGLTPRGIALGASMTGADTIQPAIWISGRPHLLATPPGGSAPPSAPAAAA